MHQVPEKREKSKRKLYTKECARTGQKLDKNIKMKKAPEDIT